MDYIAVLNNMVSSKKMVACHNLQRLMGNLKTC